jgi:2-polyprenyl-6-methoxyphenol hydroxylase-like FAD-dependent oxidoreductase
MRRTITRKVRAKRFSDDFVRAAIRPIVRQAVADLGGGKYAIALGDVHVTMDPLLGQGANIGSYSAFVLADAIEEARSFDLAFCHEVERARAARVLGAARWTNAFLQPPDEARVELLVAMSRNRQLAQEYFDNFGRPDRQWDRVGSPGSIRAWLRETHTHPALRTPVAVGP